MNLQVPIVAAALLFASVCTGAQQPAAPAPAFAAPNLSDKGVRSLAATCAACHGTFGRPAPGATLPGLAGIPKEETLAAMSQFKAGKRPATVMHQIAKGFTDEEIAAMADYFSKLPR